jgi:hypothetical protein
MPTSVIHQGLSLDRDQIMAFISEHICGLIQIYNLCGVEDERAWDFFYDIIFPDPVTTRHFAQFQLMWPHRRSRSSPFREWGAAFPIYIWQMFVKTHDQLNNWRWDNRRAFGDQVYHANLQTTSSGKVNHTSEHFSWYGREDLRAMIEPRSCRQYKPCNFLAIRPANWDEIINEDDDDDNRADPEAPIGGRSHRGEDNENHHGEGEQDTQGSVKVLGKWMGTKDGKGKGQGKGKGNGKGKCIVKLYEADSDTEG